MRYVIACSVVTSRLCLTFGKCSTGIEICLPPALNISVRRWSPMGLLPPDLGLSTTVCQPRERAASGIADDGMLGMSLIEVFVERHAGARRLCGGGIILHFQLHAETGEQIAPFIARVPPICRTPSWGAVRAKSTLPHTRHHASMHAVN